MDIGWGLGFIMIAMIAYMSYPLSMRNAITLILVTLWGLRLALFIFKRSQGAPEDFRYALYRREWGSKANLHAYFKIFLFQGFMMVIISLPFIFGMRLETQELSIINRIGMMVWVTGMVLEMISDNYLLQFKMNPKNKGRILTTGPWKLCRFPNYFGEVMLWYGIYLLNFNLVNSWTIIGPIAINLLILKVTGVPFMEEKNKENVEYIEYSQRVPKFIPFTKP